MLADFGAHVVVITADPARLERLRARVGVPFEIQRALPAPNARASCLASHIAALHAREHPVTMLEDDAIFRPHWWRATQVPDDADVVYLGAQHLARPTAISPGVVSAPFAWRTHAYHAPNPAALALAMGELADAHPHVHADIALGRAAHKRYALWPNRVGQDATPSLRTGRPCPRRFFDAVVTDPAVRARAINLVAALAPRVA